MRSCENFLLDRIGPSFSHSLSLSINPEKFATFSRWRRGVCCDTSNQSRANDYTKKLNRRSPVARTMSLGDHLAETLAFDGTRTLEAGARIKEDRRG